MLSLSPTWLGLITRAYTSQNNSCLAMIRSVIPICIGLLYNVHACLLIYIHVLFYTVCYYSTPWTNLDATSFPAYAHPRAPSRAPEPSTRRTKFYFPMFQKSFIPHTPTCSAPTPASNLRPVSPETSALVQSAGPTSWLAVPSDGWAHALMKEVHQRRIFIF